MFNHTQTGRRRRTTRTNVQINQLRYQDQPRSAVPMPSTTTRTTAYFAPVQCWPYVTSMTSLRPERCPGVNLRSSVVFTSKVFKHLHTPPMLLPGMRLRLTTREVTLYSGQSPDHHYIDSLMRTLIPAASSSPDLDKGTVGSKGPHVVLQTREV